MWRLRAFGLTILTMGIVALVFIPYLIWADRRDEVPEAIVAGAVAIALGFVIVKFLTKPTRW